MEDEPRSTCSCVYTYNFLYGNYIKPLSHAIRQHTNIMACLCSFCAAMPLAVPSAAALGINCLSGISPCLLPPSMSLCPMPPFPLLHCLFSSSIFAVSPETAKKEVHRRGAKENCLGIWYQRGGDMLSGDFVWLRPLNVYGLWRSGACCNTAGKLGGFIRLPEHRSMRGGAWRSGAVMGGGRG